MQHPFFYTFRLKLQRHFKRQYNRLCKKPFVRPFEMANKRVDTTMQILVVQKEYNITPLQQFPSNFKAREVNGKHSYCSVVWFRVENLLLIHALLFHSLRCIVVDGLVPKEWEKYEKTHAHFFFLTLHMYLFCMF